MEPMLWDPNLETGHMVVDTQHQAIFKAFNKLLRAMNRGRGRDEVHITLVFLKDYTQRHFSMEEGLMAQSGYPDRERHGTLHREFIDKLDTISDRSDRGASVTIALMQFMKDWLLEHIQVEDKRLVDFLSEQEEARRS